MNSLLDLLHPYPFERLKQHFSDVTPNPKLSHISLGAGEPKHATPKVVTDAYVQAISATPCELAHYPATGGTSSMRDAIASWINRRYGIQINASTQILPINGSREALFSFSRVVIDPVVHRSVVISPNPFYQIYEGAAILNGAQLYFINQTKENGYSSDWDDVPSAIWEKTALVYVCSPGNPTGSMLSYAQWSRLFELSDQYHFIIAADECYSEIYALDRKPVGALQVAYEMGRRDFKNLMVFNSLSKRSNVPGMRSGFCAGDAALIKKFLLYRTYNGGAMSPAVQTASIAAWSDEAHVENNRAQYEEKFKKCLPLLKTVLDVEAPAAGFFLWVKVPDNDEAFAKKLYQDCHVTVLPGSYLARNQDSINPGKNHVRMALVAEIDECLEAITRIVEFVKINYLMTNKEAVTK